MFPNVTYSWKAFYSEVQLDPKWFSGTELYWIVGCLFLIEFVFYKKYEAEKQQRLKERIILLLEREENIRRILKTGNLGRRQNTTSAKRPLLSSPQAKASLVSPALGGPSRKTPPCSSRGTSHSEPPSSSAAAHHHPGPPSTERPRQPKTNGCAFQATSELHSILPCLAPGPEAQRPPKAAPLEVHGSDSSLSLGEVDFQDLDAYLYTALGYRRIPLWGPSELQKPPGGLKGLFSKVRATFRRYKYKIPSPGDFQRGQDGPGPYASNTPSQLRSHKKKIRKCLINLCCNW